MKIISSTPSVLAIKDLDFGRGILIPHTWFSKVLTKSGAPDMTAIIILSEIVYWHRLTPVYEKDELVGYKKKFEGKELQKQSKDFAKKFGWSAKTVNEALNRLVVYRLITRNFKDVSFEKYVAQERQYIDIVPENIIKITFDCEEVVTKGINETFTPPKRNVEHTKNTNTKDYCNTNHSFSSASHEAGELGEDISLKNFAPQQTENLACPLTEQENPKPPFAPAPLSPEVPDGFRLVQEDEVLPNGDYTHVFKQGYCITNAPLPHSYQETPQNIDIQAHQETNGYTPLPIDVFVSLAKSWGCNGKSESYALEFWHHWDAKNWVVNEKGNKMRNHTKRFEDFVADKTAKKKATHPAYKGAVDLFFAHYEKEFGTAYIGFGKKEGVAMNGIIDKLTQAIINKQREAGNIVESITPEELVNAFDYLLINNKDEWIRQKLSPMIINDKFNDILKTVKENYKQQNNGNIKHTPKSDNRAKSHDELAYETYRIVAAKYGITVEELLARESASHVPVS